MTHKTITILNDRLTKEILKSTEYKNQTIISKNIKKNIFYCINYNLKQHPQLQELNLFDFFVFNSVVNFYFKHDQKSPLIFTTQEIYNLNHKREDRLNKSVLARIENSLENLAKKCIKFNKEETFLKNNQQIKATLTEWEPLLFLSKLEPEEKKELNLNINKTYYKLKKKPIILDFLQENETNEFLGIPQEFFTLSSSNVNQLKIFSYLAPLIISMQNEKINNVINYKTIFKNLQIDFDAITPTQRQIIKNQIKTILTKWKNKNLIKDFTEINKTQLKIDTNKSFKKDYYISLPIIFRCCF